MLDHFAAAGTPYVGCLYAGLMLTADGPRLVEYNVRFGDPEAQAVLPLLRSDLAALALAATQGDITAVPLEVAPGAACTVVAAAAGYPASPRLGDPILTTMKVAERPPASSEAILFLSGVTGGRVSGGRVLAVTGVGPDLAAAREAAYEAMDGVSFTGKYVRRDIGWRAPGAALRSYAAAGVDIDEGNRAVAQMKAAVERTHGAEVVRGVGSFGGAFAAKALTTMDDPVLVASTDGVGTKVELAARLGRVRGTGIDIVNHCVGDILVQSARPLFFLDYIAASTLDADLVADVVGGMAAACEAAGCTLLGGETAEMPGVYVPGAFDIAGTIVGVAERASLLPRQDVTVGDVLIGVASSGPHTNGYSLLRKLFAWIPMEVVPDGMDRPLGDALLEPHRNYLDVLSPSLATGGVKALAHITGGGLPENVPRVLPSGVDARIELGSWPVPALFRLVRELATGLDAHELHRTLNMGIGMVVVCAASHRKSDRHRFERRLRVRVVDRRHHQCVTRGERLGQLIVAPPPGEEHPIGTAATGDGDGVFTLPLARMASPHHQRRRPTESRASVGERPHQQRDPLGRGEAPDVDQHRGVTVGTQQTIEVTLAVGHGAGALVPAAGILNEPMPEQRATSQWGHRSWTERQHVHPVGNVRDPLGIDPQQLDGHCTVSGRHDHQVVGGVSLATKPVPPRLAMDPLPPTRGSQQLSLRNAELGHRVRGPPCPFRHANERRSHGPRQSDAFVHRLEELELGAVKMRDDGTVGPVPPHGVVLRRQVMKMKDIGTVGSNGPKRSLPHRRQMLHKIGGHRRQQHVRGTVAILERRMHRHQRTDRTPARFEHAHRVGVVEVLNRHASEERRRVGLVPRLAERPRHELHRPANSRQRRRQISHHLRRPTTRERTATPSPHALAPPPGHYGWRRVGRRPIRSCRYGAPDADGPATASWFSDGIRCPTSSSRRPARAAPRARESKHVGV